MWHVNSGNDHDRYWHNWFSEDQTTELGNEKPGEATKTLPFQESKIQKDKVHKKMANTIQLQPIAPPHAIETELLDDKTTGETQVLSKFVAAKKQSTK